MARNVVEYRRTLAALIGTRCVDGGVSARSDGLLPVRRPEVHADAILGGCHSDHPLSKPIARISPTRYGSRVENCMMHRMSWLVVGLVVAVGFGSGCASRYIQQEDVKSEEGGFYIDDEAEIKDNDKNRQVIDVLQQYRRALVQKDIGALKRLVSEQYYDNAGTTDTTEDDYGRGRLPKIFEIIANHAEKIEYKVTVQNLEYKRKRAMVSYEYRYAYKYDIGKKPTWDAGVEMNQVELVREDGTWKIASGL